MTIRLMKITDYDEVYQLWSGTAGMGMRSLDDSADGIARLLLRNPATCFVAQQDETIAGVILCGNDGRRGYIYHTAVKSEFRRRGIAKALVYAVLDALRKEQIYKVALVAFSKNELGNRFWASMGFEERNDLVYRNLSLNAENK